MITDINLQFTELEEGILVSQKSPNPLQSGGQYL